MARTEEIGEKQKNCIFCEILKFDKKFEKMQKYAEKTLEHWEQSLNQTNHKPSFIKIGQRVWELWPLKVGQKWQFLVIFSRFFLNISKTKKTKAIYDTYSESPYNCLSFIFHGRKAVT